MAFLNPHVTAPAAPLRSDRLSLLVNWARERGGHILVVDDSPTNLLVTEAILSSVGFTVSLATGGTEALDVMRDSERAPDAVLMDLAMPDMDGAMTTAAIRALPPPHGRVVIIALTANGQPEDRMRCIEAGMDDFLTKPAGKATLLTTLHQWMCDG
ncbi:response regulator [Azospirillum sp. RWY-5-1]|nr:response regulator [Azospirillum oleiclasticum]NYZ15041.1 response regulator [Azospirillum oleiclasticum]